MDSLPAKIIKRARAHRRGRRVYTPKDFLDLGNRAAVDQALSRLVKNNHLRRVGRGLYDFPRTSLVLNRPIPPRTDAVVGALVRRGMRIMSDGIVAANGLGLTNAVPAKASFVTDGQTRTFKVGGRTMYLRRAPRRLMAWANRPGAPVVQALDWLGQNAASDPKVVATLRACLPKSVKNDLQKGLGNLPGWAIPIINQVVRNERATV